MAIQFSVALRNARGDAIETTIGTSGKVEIRTGAQPATCATAASGTLLATFALASDWASAASSGVKTLTSMPVAATAGAAGTAAHYRFTDSAGTTCHMQGTITATGGGGDLTIDNVVIANGQAVNITGWTITEPHA
jgi:hypothetical protein